MADSGGAIFDRIGEAYEEYHAANVGQLRALDLLSEQLDPSSVVLDLGCGTGSPAGEVLCARGHQYLGVDSSRVMISAGVRKSLGSAVFLLGDIRQAASWAARVDAVVAHFSLLMLSRQEIQNVFTDIHASLRSGGLLSIAMPEFEGDQIPVTFMGESFPASGFTLEQLVDLLTSSGFEVLDAYRHLQDLDGTEPEPQVFVLARLGKGTPLFGDGAAADFLYELGYLKRLKRTGWEFSNSVQDDVAGHSFRVSLIAVLLALESGMDPKEAALYGLLHDVHEARTGDRNHPAAKCVQGIDIRQVLADQGGRLPRRIALLLRRFGFVPDGPLYELVHDADRLVALLHVRETLVGQPALMEQWIEYLFNLLKSDHGRSLARSIMARQPSDWWTEAVSNGGPTQ